MTLPVRRGADVVTRWPQRLDDLADVLNDHLDDSVEDLGELVRIPSISAPSGDPQQLQRSAQATADLLIRSGLEHVQLLEVPGAHPYVYGSWQGAGTSAPTVLLYAHHDVQPVNTPDRWSFPPFEPVVEDGRLYGRGSSDDKGGILVHCTAVKTWLTARGRLPVNVKVVIEGEEEIGSPNLPEFLAAHARTLRSDVMVLTDAVNWKVGVPALTCSLRGLAEVYVTVTALEQPVHSGMWGGAVPDALTGLLKALATLTDERGRPSVRGLTADVRPPTQAERDQLEALERGEEERLRQEAGMLEGVEWVGELDLPLLERFWLRPAIAVIGIDVPSVDEASNQLIARAEAKVSIRLAPGQDPQRATRLVSEHLRAAVPWGLHVETRAGVATPAWSTDPEGAAFQAAENALRWGFVTEPVRLGCGGTIPFVEPFSKAFGGAPCLLTAVGDPASNAHGEDESLHLGDFARACLSEAFLFDELAQRAGQLNVKR